MWNDGGVRGTQSPGHRAGSEEGEKGGGKGATQLREAERPCFPSALLGEMKQMASPLWASIYLSAKVGEVAANSTGSAHCLSVLSRTVQSVATTSHTHYVQRRPCVVYTPPHPNPPQEALSVSAAAWLEHTVSILQTRILRLREVGHSFIVRTRTQESNPGLGWDAGVSLGLQHPLRWPLVGRLGP